MGAGVNTDEIESVIAGKRGTLKNKITKDILKILVLLISILALVLVVARYFSNRTKKSFDLFSTFFSRATTESVKIDPKNLPFVEFEDLGHSANRMIDERAKAENALMDSEEKYRQLVENSNDAIFIAHDGVIKFCNPKTEELTGHSQEEMSRIPFSAFIYPEDRKMVDDEEILVELQRQMLERVGYRVSLRTSSIEALEAFRAGPQRFDLVITYMTMPNMTGDILAKEIMTIRPDITVILCTGYSDRITPEKAKSMGIRDLIMKPVVVRDLAEAIRGARKTRLWLTPAGFYLVGISRPTEHRMTGAME